MKTSRLLSLPTELRLRIYEYALTAPDNAIGLYFSYQTNRVKPDLGLGLLRTCRQIYHEARDVLYTKNTILIVSSSRETRLPPHALRELRHLFVMVNYGFLSDAFEAENVDSRMLRAMTKLQRLRLCVFDQFHFGRDGWGTMLPSLVESVPAGCEIRFGLQRDVEKEFVYSYFGRSADEKTVTGEVERCDLEEAMARIEALKGAKSGWNALPSDQAGSRAVDELDEGPRTW